MSCQIEGCNRSNYHFNPLISPLIQFDKKIVALGGSLPSLAKASEIIIRIGDAIISPFAYLKR